MTVGTLDEHRLTVDKQLAVLDFDLAEAHFLRDDLHDIALTVLDNGKECI